MQQRALAAGVVLSLLAAAPAWGQPIRQFRGHHAPVSAVAFAPDGQSLASASFDHSIKVWDVPRGAVVQTLAGHRDKVLTLAYTADGRRLASAGRDGTIRIWDPAAGTPEARLALAGLDGLVRVHDLATGRRLHLLEGHHDAVYSLAFAPDGGSLLSGSGDRTLRRWDVEAGKELACLDGHCDAVYQVGFSADGRRLVSAGTDGQVLVWDAVTGATLHRHRFPCKALCAAFTPDGRHVGTGTGQAVCYLLELPRHIR